MYGEVRNFIITANYFNSYSASGNLNRVHNTLQFWFPCYCSSHRVIGLLCSSSHAELFVFYSRSWLWKTKQSIWGITVGPPKLPEHWVPITQPRTPLKMKRNGFRRRLAKLLRMAVYWYMRNGRKRNTQNCEPPCYRWKQQSHRKKSNDVNTVIVQGEITRQII